MAIRNRMLILAGIVVVVGTALVVGKRGDRSGGTIVIGGKQFTEQEVLGELMAILIETETDLRVDRRLNLGGTMICFNALKAGDIDVYPEYTGTGLVNILKMGVVNDPDKAYQVVQREFHKRHGLTWLEPFGFNNTYTLTMRRDQARQLGIETISDLASAVNRTPTSSSVGLRAAFDAEFLTRPDGYRGLSRAYGFKFASDPMQMDPGLMYKAVADGAVDVIDGFATDGRIPAYGLLVLEDDKHFFPPYYAAPLIREDTLAKYPELRAILNRLAGTLPDDTMRKLNYEVDERGRKAYDVAQEFLLSQGLIEDETGR